MSYDSLKKKVSDHTEKKKNIDAEDASLSLDEARLYDIVSNASALDSDLREKLSGTVYIAPSPIDECLNLYPEEEWRAIAEKVSALPTVTNRSAAALQRRLFGKAMECEIDRQGRIPLNDDLIKYAGMTKEIVLVGVNSKFEIWDSEKWKKSDEAYDTDMMLQGISDYEIRI